MKTLLIASVATGLLGTTPTLADAPQTCVRRQSDDLLAQGQVSFHRLERTVQMALSRVLEGTATVGSIEIAPLDATTLAIYVELTIDGVATRALARARIGKNGEISNVGPVIELEALEFIECHNCGIQLPGTTAPIVKWGVNSLLRILQVPLASVLDQQLRSVLDAKRAEFDPEGLFDGVRFLVEICATDLTVIAYTGSLQLCDEVITRPHAYDASGNEISRARATQSIVRCDENKVGLITFQLANEETREGQWTNFVIERRGGSVIAETGRLDPRANRSVALNLADYRGVPLRVVLWSPGVFGFGGIAAVFDFTPPQTGDLAIELRRRND